MTKSVDKKKFAKNLKALRTAHNHSQEFLGKKLGVGPTSISNYETEYSEPKMDTIVQIAKFYQVSVDYLIGAAPLPHEETKVSIPVVPDLNAAASIKTYYNHVSTIDCPADLLAGNDYVAYRMGNDDLECLNIEKDSLVFLNRTQAPENGDVCIIRVNEEEPMIRRYYKAENMVTLICPCPSSNIAPRAIDTRKNSIQIIGRLEYALVKI